MIDSIVNTRETRLADYEDDFIYAFWLDYQTLLLPRQIKVTTDLPTKCETNNQKESCVIS